MTMMSLLSISCLFLGRQSVCTLFEFACHASDPASFAVHYQEKAKEQAWPFPFCLV